MLKFALLSYVFSNRQTVYIFYCQKTYSGRLWPFYENSGHFPNLSTLNFRPEGQKKKQTRDTTRKNNASKTNSTNIVNNLSNKKA